MAEPKIENKTSTKKPELKEAERVTVTLVKKGQDWQVEGLNCGKCDRPLMASLHHTSVPEINKYCERVFIAEK